MVSLTEKQMEIIDENIEGFRKFLDSEEAKEWQKSMDQKRTLFGELLGSEEIRELSEKSI